MPRNVLTALDLEAIPDGGELTVTADTLVTPLAREHVAERRITLRFADSAQPGTAAGADAAKERRVVAIGADHGGYELKQQLASYLREWGYAVLDQGTDSTASVDYPDFAEAVANAVARGDAWRGIVVDSAGIGSAIAANKVPGARAALCYDRATARNSREHNDANILSLGARLIPPEAAREIVAAWLETEFGGGRHGKRVDKIRAIEARHSKV
jgi:ribose 5-phosphate isomerase B